MQRGQGRDLGSPRCAMSSGWCAQLKGHMCSIMCYVSLLQAPCSSGLPALFQMWRKCGLQQTALDPTSSQAQGLRCVGLYQGVFRKHQHPCKQTLLPILSSRNSPFPNTDPSQFSCLFLTSLFYSWKQEQ